MMFGRTREVVPASVEVPPFRYTALERGVAAVGLYGTAMGMARRRMAWEASRAYLAAAEKTRLTSGWGRIKTRDPNSITGSDAVAVRQLADWLSLNDGYGRKVVQTIIDETLSGGVTTQCRIAYSKNQTVNEQLNRRVSDLKDRWMEEADAFGRMHWFEMEELVLRRVVVAGDILLYRRYLKDPGRVLPLAYELIDGARLTTYRTDPRKGNQVNQGVEYSPDGRIVAYHVEDNGYAAKIQRLPAADVQLPFVLFHPDQLRGISWLAPVIRDLYDLRDLKEYALIARKVQSAIAVIISEDPKGGTPPPVPGLNPGSGNSIVNAVGDPMRKIEPGMIQYAGSGKVTSHIPSPTNDLDPLSSLVARGVGVGLGLSYEWVTGDYTRTTHAGGRLGNQYPRKRITHTHGWFCRRVLKQVHRDFVDMAIAMGEIRVPGAKADPYAARFGRPHWDWGVNPQQEVNASIQAIEAGISTIREEVEARGGEWEDFLRQIKTEIDFGSRLGLTLHQTLRGGPQGGADGSDGDGGEDGSDTAGQDAGDQNAGA